MKKSIVRKITEAKLKKYLNKIGWDIKGNELNRYIYNDRGEETLLRIWNNHLEIRASRLVVKEFGGSLVLHFSSFWLEYLSDGVGYPMVSLVLPINNSLKQSKTFLSFYGEKQNENI